MIRVLLYGTFGWCAEIVWTAVHDVAASLIARRAVDLKLAGHTYLWMLPIYGVGGRLFEVVHTALGGAPWPLRGMVYMLGCFAVEYATGFAIKRLAGEIPWDYSHRRWHVHGLIRLDYAPVWFCFGLLLEHVEVAVKAMESGLRAAGP
jgi:uncharacterized membrane protein